MFTFQSILILSCAFQPFFDFTHIARYYPKIKNSNPSKNDLKIPMKKLAYADLWFKTVS